MNYNWLKTDYSERKKNSFLYELNEDSLNVYKLEPISALMEEYKRNYMKQIVESERVFKISNLKGLTSPLLFSNRKWSYICNNNLFVNENVIINSQKEKEFLETYYKRITPTDGRTHILIDNAHSGDKKFLILPSNKVSTLYWEMNAILNVPETLFNLENFLLGEFNSLTDEDISELAYLFQKKYIESFTLEMLSNLEKDGLAYNIVDKAKEKVQETQRILKHF